MAQQPSYSPIGSLLHHPNNALINAPTFLKFLLEKNPHGRRNIMTLGAKSLEEVIKIAKTLELQ